MRQVMAPLYIAREYEDQDDEEQEQDPTYSNGDGVAKDHLDTNDLDEHQGDEYDDDKALYGGDGEGCYYEAGEDDYYEDDEYGDVEFARPATPPRPVELVSDVDDGVYFDEASLARCWSAALSDYKFLHPSSFLPSVEAPRSQKAKRLAAPLWYGPLPASSTASTSSLGRSPSVFSISTTISTTNGPGKSSKALKNAKKRARKQRAAEAAAAGQKRPRLAELDDDDDDDGPSWTPTSPSHQRAHSLIPQSPPTVPQPPLPPSTRFASTSIRTLSSAAGPSLPRPTSPTPPTSFLPTLSAPSASTSILLEHRKNYPKPPPIVPLESGMIESVRAERRGTSHGGEEEDETPEGLLQSALWSWYTAGYQTALYHAAVGVAGVRERRAEE